MKRMMAAEEASLTEGFFGRVITFYASDGCAGRWLSIRCGWRDSA